MDHLLGYFCELAACYFRATMWNNFTTGCPMENWRINYIVRYCVNLWFSNGKMHYRCITDQENALPDLEARHFSIRKIILLRGESIKCIQTFLLSKLRQKFTNESVNLIIGSSFFAEPSCTTHWCALWLSKAQIKKLFMKLWNHFFWLLFCLLKGGGNLPPAFSKARVWTSFRVSP